MRPLTLTAGPIYRSSSGPIQAHSIGTEVDLIIGPEVALRAMLARGPG
jgi:hypothetical protein